jgi:hypothetical protein
MRWGFYAQSRTAPVWSIVKTPVEKSMSQTMQRQTNPMPVWLVFCGGVIGVVGAIVTKHADSVGEFILALSIRAGASDVAAAVVASDWGLGLLCAGAVVVLAGLVAIATRRPS